MEWLDKFADIVANNWDKVLLWLTTPIVAGFSIWKIGSIIVAFIKNRTAKKYLKQAKEEKEKTLAEIRQLKEFVEETIKAEIKVYADTLVQTFNDLEKKKQEVKEQIYEKIFNEKMEVQEVVQEIAIEPEQEPEIEPIAEETEKVEEVIEEEPIEPKKADLL